MKPIRRQLFLALLVGALFFQNFLVAQTNSNALSFNALGIGGGGYTYTPSISPHDPNDVFLNCDMAGVYRSQDGGSTWRMQSYLQLTSRVKAKMQFTADPKIMFTVARSRTNLNDPRWRGELMKSTDGGATFQKITDPTATGIHRLEVDPASTQRMILNEYDRLFFTSNGGASWTQVFTPPSGNMWLGGVFWDGATILVGTNEGLLVSKNSGASFSIENHAGLPAGSGIYHLAGAKSGTTTRLFCIPTLANEMAAWLDVREYRGNLRGIFRMNYSATAAWTNSRGTIPADIEIGWVDLAKNNNQTIWLAAANLDDSPLIFKSTDGGATWANTFQTAENQNIATGWGGDYGAVSWQWSGAALGFDVADNDPNRVILSDGLGHLTTDGGATWRATYVQPSSRNAVGQPAQIQKFYQSSGLDVTSTNHIFWKNDSEVFLSNCDIGHTFSNDGGTSWTLARNTFRWGSISDNNWYRVVRQPSTGHLFAAASDENDIFEEDYADYPLDFAGGVVLKSTDGGATFDTVFNFKHPVVWLEIDRNDPSKIYASVVHSVQGGIFRSTNGGVSWQKLATPPRTAGHPYNLHSLADGSLVATFAARYFTYTDSDGNELDSLTQSSGVFLLPAGSTVWEDRTAAAMRYFTKDLTIDPHDPAQNTWYATVWGGHSTFFDPKNPNNGNGGLYRTTNRGQSWTRIFADEQAQNLGISPVQPGKAWLCLENNGLFSTENLKDTQPDFERVVEFPYWRPKRVFFRPGAGCEVWIGTMGGGIWRGESDSGAAPTADFSFLKNDLNVSFSNASANAATYSWSFGDPNSGASNTSIEANPTHVFSAAGDFTVVLTATNACGVSQQISKTVSITCSVANAAIQPQDPTICAGESVSLSTTSSFSTYQWSDGQFIPTVVKMPQQTSTLTVTVTDAKGCTSTAATTISVAPKPTAQFSVAATNGLAASFSNTSANSTSFFWDFGDGSAASTEANPTHQFSAAGNFTVVLTATNDCGSATFSQEISVNCPPVVVSISAAGATAICPGQSVQFSATAGFQNYSWLRDGQQISVAAGANFSANSAGNYSVVATDAAGCTGTSQAISVSEKPLPTANFSFLANDLNVSFSNASANSNSFSWDFGDGSPASTEANPTHQFSAAGNFTVVLTATNDCGSASFSQVLDLQCPPVLVSLAAAGSPSFCPGGSVLLNATAGFQKYEWLRDGQVIAGATAANFSANLGGNYSVVATDAAGCTGTSQAISVSEKPLPTASFSFSKNDLNVSFSNTSANATSFSWNFGDGLPISIEASPTHVFSSSGNFTVVLTATNDCGSITFSQQITVFCTPPTVQISTSGSTQICAGESVLLESGGGVFASFQWFLNGGAIPSANSATFSATASGIYKVEVSDATGCTNFSNEMTIKVSLLPVAAVESPNSGKVCEGAAAWLHGTGGIGYQWLTPNGSLVAGQEIPFPAAQIGQSGTYFLTVTDGAGCSATTSFLFEVLPLPMVSIANFPANFTNQDLPITLVGVPAGGVFSGTGVAAGQFDPAAAGLGTHMISYTFTDAAGCSAVAVATTVVSPFVSTQLPEGFESVVVFPNPSSGDFFLKIKILESKSLKINLLNPLGQVLESRFFDLQAGESRLFFGKSGLPAGAYFLEILDGSGRILERVTIAD